ncbi:MAG: hypothetical protein V4555_01345 [Acidobacteriota bacterium]
MYFRNLTVCRTSALTAAALSLAASAVLSGCAFGTAATTASPNIVPALTGHTFGGTQPITGATVKIYATGNTPGDGTSTNDGYGIGTLLAEATQQGASAGQDTDATGKWSFAGGYNCPAGQFAYIVSSGGDTGTGSVNSNAVLVAALGRCEDLYNFATTYTGYKGASIDVNELTTVAAAYALGHFATVTGTGASTVVSIGAPATNNAAQVGGVSTGCINGIGACTTTAAAGLAHAFQNALSLASPFITGSDATANVNLPSNSGAVVPQQLINSLANVMVTCVNSKGGSAGDNNACGAIFTATTLNSVAPTNTFSAYANLASNPALGGSAVACANFLNLAVPQAQDYNPVLSATTNITDLSIAINYPAGMGATTGVQGIQYTQSGALDINDNFYFGNQDVSSGTINNLGAIGANGAFLGMSSNGSGNGYKDGYGASVDTHGGVYLVNGGGSTTKPAMRYTTSGGVPSASATNITLATPGNAYMTALDQANNLWILTSATTGNNLLESTYANSSAGTPSAATGKALVAGAFPSSKILGLAVDPAQNIWATIGSSLTILENTGTVAAPAYSGTVFTTTLDSSGAGSGIAFSGTPTSFTAYVSSYQGTPTGVETIVPTLTGAAVTSFASHSLSSPTAITGSFYNQVDGNGTLWVADTNTHSVVQFIPGGTAARLKPCLAATPGVSSTCVSGGAFGANGKPTSVSLDSAGDIWISDGAGNNIVEVIGSAAPTWPQLSLGLSGKP